MYFSESSGEDKMNDEAVFDHINEAKANMDHLYDQADPRAYFRELRRFGYNIPGAAKPIFQKLIFSLQKKRRMTVSVF